MSKQSENLKKLWSNPEYREMMSRAHIGQKGYWTGKKRPDISKKMTGRKGNPAWNKGRIGYMKGSLNGNWGGGLFVSKQGYKYILKEDHPHKTKLGYVLEHRLIMEKYLGRYLSPKEIVHHINGNKLDNRIENLVVMTQKHHVGEHFCLHGKWAKNFNKCIECGTTKIKHSCNGRCAKCGRHNYYVLRNK